MKSFKSKMIAISSLSLLMAACSSHSDNKQDEAAAMAIAYDPVVQLTANSKNAASVHTIEDAFAAMRDVRAARLAIFDGSGSAAKTFVDEAKTKLTAAMEKAGQMKVSKDGEIVDGAYVPIDVAMAITEDYSASPAKAAKIAEANAHLAKGEQKEAADVLRLANVNVLTRVALLPVESSTQLITDAAKLLEDNKYYDANLALKALEDSIILQDYDVDGVPAAVPVDIKSTPATASPAQSQK